MSVKRPLSFTSEYPGLSNVLVNDVHVFQSFDPNDGKEYTGHPFKALWDTGATNTMITQRVVETCGLYPITMATMHHADGSSLVEVYMVNVRLPNSVGFPNVRVMKGQLLGAYDLLIGMDIIGAGDFAVTNAGGKTLFTYRFPSIGGVDFVRNPPKGIDPPSRNGPCPCGSGKKYKRCCGR